MKLSEAIRLGAMLRPQTFEMLVDDVGTCAFGAAWEAEGLLDKAVGGNIPTPVDWKWPYGHSACPCCGLASITFPETVIHLNDFHRWTREQIADWVETLEAQPTVPTQEPAHETQ